MTFILDTACSLSIFLKQNNLFVLILDVHKCAGTGRVTMGTDQKTNATEEKQEKYAEEK